MLVSILGNLGSGKTLFAVINAFYSDLPIVSNFFISFLNRTIESFDLDKFLQAKYENCIILLDEAYNYLESRISGSELNRIMSYILFQSRKKNVTIYITAQLFSTIDKRFRELSDIVVEAEQEYKVKFNYIITNFKNTRLISIDYQKAAFFFTMYNTNEVILNHNEKLEFSLKKGTEKMSIITNIATEIIEFYNQEKVEHITHNLVKLYFTTHKLPAFLSRDVYTQAKLLEKRNTDEIKKIKKKKTKKKEV